MRVLACPDKCKGTLTAPQAAAAIARGVLQVVPAAEVRLVPVADGGEGTVGVVLAAGAGPRSAVVSDPWGRPVTARWARRGELAVLEVAAASGLGLVEPSDDSALRSDTFGTGELIRAALDDGASSLVLGLGGSASTDGGTGILRALGARFSDAQGVPLPAGGGALVDLAAVDLSGLDPRLADVPLVLCCDVSSPLLGPAGSAAVFAPQKGASAATVQVLEHGLSRLAEVLTGETGCDIGALDWGGAAGGIAAGLHAALGATFRSGIDEVADLVDLDAQLIWADLVVVGEGSLDEQSLAGKAPVGIAERAARQGVSVVAVAGRITVAAEELATHGISHASSAVEAAGSVDAALADPERWAAAAAAQVVREFSPR